VNNLVNNNTNPENFDIFEDIRVAREQRERKLNEKKQKIMREKAILRAKLRKRMFCFIACVFMVACAVLYRNAVIIQSTTKIDTLSKQLEYVRSENVKNELALEKSVDLSYVEEVATRKLGMKRPDKFQTVYVDVTQNNYAEVMNLKNKDNRFYGTFSVITPNVSNIVEYLH
jgi:cell division protein FtsL